MYNVIKLYVDNMKLQVNVNIIKYRRICKSYTSIYNKRYKFIIIQQRGIYHNISI